MGWVYGFHSLDPAVVASVLAASPADLVARLQAGGYSPEDVGSEAWEDIDENAALAALATTREWDIDKSLDELRRVLEGRPELSSVSRLLGEMEDFTASGLPERFHPVDVGLMGIAMPETVAAAAAALEPYAGVDGRARLADIRLPMLKRLLSIGQPGRIREDDALWENWTRLTEAVAWAHGRGDWLGLHAA